MPRAPQEDNTEQRLASPTKHARRRRWLLGAFLFVLLALVVGIARVGFLRGLFAPLRISGESMAPALFGEHRAVVCEACGWKIRCDAISAPSTGQTTCLHCGFADNAFDSIPVEPGQRVIIDRWPLVFREPKRFEIVAAQENQNPERSVVKRVIGLPGESVSFVQGDLLIDGQLVHKSIDELQTMAIFLYDNDHRPSDEEDLPARWRPTEDDSMWTEIATKFEHSPPSIEADQKIDWLVYHHQICLAPPHDRNEESLVLDSYGYNQGMSRQLFPVRDLLLSIEAEWQPPDTLALRAEDGPTTFVVLLRKEESGRSIIVTLLVDGQEQLTKEVDSPRAKILEVEFALCDQQLLLRLDGDRLITYPFDRDQSASPSDATPLALGADGAMNIPRIRIYRDLHYLSPLGLSDSWKGSHLLASDEFFLLGDNLPASRDSRHWPEGEVLRRQIWGTLLPWH